MNRSAEASQEPQNPAPFRISAGPSARTLAGRTTPNAPIPGALAGALIGRIDNGRPFGIGNQTSIVAPASGLLRSPAAMATPYGTLAMLALMNCGALPRLPNVSQ